MRSLVGAVLFLLITLAGPATSSSALSALEEGEWQLIEIDDATVSLPAGAKHPTIGFETAESRASGFAGCNNFFSRYQLSGDSLILGPVGATRRACADAQSELELRFLGMLENVRAWALTNGVLTLLGEDGQSLARFTRPRGGDVAPDLDSITIRSSALRSKSVQLENGVFRAPAAPGAASEIVVKLTDQRAFTVIDGQDVGVVVVASSTGGSGTFVELALLSKTEQDWKNIDTVLLGDRVKVRQVRLESGDVVLDLLTHGSNDPACCPTQETTKRFRVDNGRLVDVAENRSGDNDGLAGTRWQWVQTRHNNDTETVPGNPENYTIQFDEGGKLSVKADCNVKGGSYTVDGKAFSIKILISTMAACEPGSLEEDFVRDLDGAALYFFNDGDLLIDLKYDSGTMRFSRIE